jgi:hypothetical protein
MTSPMKKRAELQDTLVTMKQNDNPNDPVAAQKASIVQDELIEEAVPDLSQKLAAMPQQPQMQQPQQMM